MKKIVGYERTLNGPEVIEVYYFTGLNHPVVSLFPDAAKVFTYDKTALDEAACRTSEFMARMRLTDDCERVIFIKDAP